MQILAKETSINFIGLRFVAFVMSLLMIAAGIYSLSTQGLNYGIDFAGGTKVELIYEQDVPIESVRSELQNGGYGDAVVQYFGSNRDVLIRIPLSEENNDVNSSTRLVEYLNATDLGAATLRSVEFVGPTFGKELFEKGILALIYSLIGVMIYVAFRFEWKFSLGSVVALIHDVVITLGIFSIIGLEFTLPVLAALLAVIGYSLNDTIVVYDRIRENLKKYRKMDLVDLLNLSVNETLARTVMTSLTLIVALLPLLLFGPASLFGLVAAITLGVVIGTYSSVYMASPLLIWFGVNPSSFVPEETVADRQERIARGEL